MILSDPGSTSMDLRFRLFGTYVRVHPFFWLMSAILGWNITRGRHVLPGNGLGDLALWVLCVFVSILLHEFGHVWMGRLFGSSNSHIVLYSMGGLAIGSNSLSRRWQRILVSFAGPGIQLLFAALILGSVVGLEAAGQSPTTNPVLLRCLDMLFWINTFWPLFNLLPIWPLDGGMISREVLIGLAPSRGLIASLWISLTVAAVIALNALVEHFQKRALIPWIPFGGLYVGILFAVFAVSNFQAIQEASRRNRYYDDDLPWER